MKIIGITPPTQQPLMITIVVVEIVVSIVFLAVVCLLNG